MIDVTTIARLQQSVINKYQITKVYINLNGKWTNGNQMEVKDDEITVTEISGSHLFLSWVLIPTAYKGPSQFSKKLKLNRQLIILTQKPSHL